MTDKEIPNGAIENGRVLMERLEHWYKFEDDNNHPLSNCAEWVELKMCFEYLVEHLNK